MESKAVFKPVFEADCLAPVFIQPALLQRLSVGAFVPHRVRQVLDGETRQNNAERRQRHSRLHQTRQGIPYEPRVFENRFSDVMRLASLLNDRQTRLILVSGPSGIGKTTLVRGVIELFGGGPEQLLWLHPTLLDNADTLRRQLLQGVGESLDLPVQLTLRENLALTQALHRLAQAHCPLCIVIDPVSVLLNGPDRLPAEILALINQLLSVPNVKLILVGHRLPMAHLSHSRHALPMAGVTQITLSSLPPLVWQALFPQDCRLNLPSQNLASPTPASRTLPTWLPVWVNHLKACAREQAATPAEAQEEISALSFAVNNTPVTPFNESKTLQAQLIPFWEALWQQQQAQVLGTKSPPPHVLRQLLWILLCVRHPLTEAMVREVLPFCPEPSPADLDLKTCMQASSALGTLLQRQQHPQEVFWIWPALKTALLTTLQPTAWSEITKIHLALGRFYASQAQKPTSHRLIDATNVKLMAESQYHADKTGDLAALMRAVEKPLIPTHPPDQAQAIGFQIPVFLQKPSPDLSYNRHPASEIDVTGDPKRPLVKAKAFEIPKSQTPEAESRLSTSILDNPQPDPDVETLVEAYLAQGQWRSAAYALAMAALEAEQAGDLQEAIEWYWQQGNVLWLEGNEPDVARQAYQAATRLGRQASLPPSVMEKLAARLQSLD